VPKVIYLLVEWGNFSVLPPTTEALNFTPGWPILCI